MPELDTRAGRTHSNGDGERLRVAHLISGLFFGGGHRSTLNLVEMLPRVAEIDVLLWTLGTCADSPVNSRRDLVIPYSGHYNRLTELWRTSRCLARLMDQHQIDVLHTHGVDADLIGGLAARNRSVQHIIHLRITPPLGQRESWKAAIRRIGYRALVIRNGTWCVAVSDAVRDQMIEYYGLPPQRVVTIRNGINTDVFTAAGQAGLRANGPVVIGTAARLAPMKGLEHLIEAAGLLDHDHVDFILRIAGSGSLLADLQRQADARQVAHRVEFVGHVEEMDEFYRQLDVFTLPSVSTEGLPLTVLEAMACGVPVVATAVGGTAEALRDGIDGFVVSPGDAAALAAALKSLVNDADARSTMGEAGRAHVAEKFSRERVAREVSDLYCRVLGRATEFTPCAS